MIQITGSVELEAAFKELGVEWERLYDGGGNGYCVYVVQEGWLTLVDRYLAEKAVTRTHVHEARFVEQGWPEYWGWWRYAQGSNMGFPDVEFVVNDAVMLAWDGPRQEEKFGIERKYNDLLEYLREEMGVSTERNVTALAVDLAKHNGYTLAELFATYQPSETSDAI